MPVIVKSPQQIQMDDAEGVTVPPSTPSPSPPPPPQPPQTVISPMIMANPYDNKSERGKAFRQVLAAVIANLGNNNDAIKTRIDVDRRMCVSFEKHI